MKRSYSMLNPNFSSPMNSPDITNVTRGNVRQPTFTTPQRTQEMPQPMYNSTPLMNNSTFQRNIGGMSPNKHMNVLQPVPKYNDCVEIVVPTPYNINNNNIDPSMPYFITSIPPTPGRVVLKSALTQQGYQSMNNFLNQHNTYRSNTNFQTQSPVITPLCDNHVHDASQLNQINSIKYFQAASTQTVETTETQTEEDLFYESSCMPKRKRGRRKKEI